MKATGLLFLFCLYCIISVAQKPYWQQQVNYNITVSLNDKEHTLDGNETMEYINNSDDTLRFIWIHLWMNAYKNDRTAFTEQQLQNGSTDFYFSNEEDKGYINRLAFKVNGTLAVKEDHPKHQDIIKIILPSPLAPKQKCTIETPFHIKLPYNFSRGGHVGQSYQITQWYPKAAVYDRKGWHEMPYLDQGEFYSDFGNYKVCITLPYDYIVAATGEADNDLLATNNSNPKSQNLDTGLAANVNISLSSRKARDLDLSKALKVITFEQNNAIDFAWFADKRFIVRKDTLALPSGRIINVASYSLPANGKTDIWESAVKNIKKSVLLRSNLIGEYPYNTVSAVQGNTKFTGGMEYPTITLISSPWAVGGMIDHEVGHNWFYGILATNEREHPWMDEGMNTYYEEYRFTQNTSSVHPTLKKKGFEVFMEKRLPKDPDDFLVRWLASEKKDQPIETSSENFSVTNYDLSAYYKASKWMQWLDTTLGRGAFDSCMRVYYREWKFKHPYPEDFYRIISNFLKRKTYNTTIMDNESPYIQINNYHGGGRNEYKKQDENRSLKLGSFFSFKDTDKYKYIFVSPGIGYNYYDKFMIGGLLHNYTLPAEKFQFLIAPLYGTGSNALNGVAKLNYHWYPTYTFQKVEVGVNGNTFSINHSLDTTGKKIFERFRKIVPYVRFYLKESPRSSMERFFDFRTYFITEKFFDNYDYIIGNDSILYPKSFTTATRYINQLTYQASNNRVLYPYSYQVQLQQGKGFYRVNITGDYFFNYAKGGGLSARFFAAKFGFIGSQNNAVAYAYQPILLGANGVNDYLYNNYFLGRTASNGGMPLVKNAGISAQQIMVPNTGGLHFRLDESVGGISDTWVSSINLNTTLPDKLFPVKIPLKLYFDAGTYAGAWKKGSTQSRFIYVGGLQLSLFKNVLNIYAPLIYSKEFKEYLNTDKEANKFTRKITFSIDIQNITLKKFFPQFAF